MSIISFVGGAAVFSSASGGKVYAFNNINTSSNTTVAPANPSRRRITFHNPGDVDIFISPTLTAAGAVLTPTTSALGGSFRVFANGGALTVEGECQTPWQALAASGSTKPLTVMDSNI